MNQQCTFTFDHEEAKGKVEVSEGHYGVMFDVTAPDGQHYTGFLDLFHFATKDCKNCFQVVVDSVTDGDTFHARFYKDGKVEVFSE